MDPIARAAQFLVEHHPAATTALLGGSHARGTATPTSDLDILVIDPTDEWAYRRTWMFDDVKVESFVYHDAEVLSQWLERELANRRATLYSLIADTVVLRGCAETEALRARAAEQLRDGPGPLPDELRDSQRYHLADIRDDLADVNPEELATLAAYAWRHCAEGFCHANAWWVGQGKWLRRYVVQLDAEFAAALDAALAASIGGDRPPMVRCADEVIARLGGRLDQTGKLFGPRW
jgi:Nucleotidyltransferase domain